MCLQYRTVHHCIYLLLNILNVPKRCTHLWPPTFPVATWTRLVNLNNDRVPTGVLSDKKYQQTSKTIFFFLSILCFQSCLSRLQ